MQFHPPGTRIAGRYEVAGRPMMGGMGIVYVCLDLEEDRPVALKTFRPEFLPDRAARDRFLREGTHWVDLGAHPHVVRCYEVVRVGDGTEVYLVLELVAREHGRDDASLRSRLSSNVHVPVETALLFALQIARGMQHAVETVPGFVHRDLKPENILVGADRLTGSDINRLRVTDFGLVRSLGTGETMQSVGDDEQLPVRPGLTRLGSIVGTPPYMAPEQWEGPEVDLRTDIYALGCILGEMLSARMLVEERTLHGFRQAHQGGRAAEITAELPSRLARVLSRCLAVDPAARYGSSAEVEAALADTYREVTDRPIPAPEPAAIVGRGARVAAGWSYSALGVSYLDLGQAEVTVGYFERARAAGAAEGEPPLEAAGLTHLGLAYSHLGESRRAMDCHQQALAISRSFGHRWGEGAALGHLGNAHADLGDDRRAIGCYEQCLTIHREIGNRGGEGTILGNLGVVCARLGDARRAIDYFNQQLTITWEMGDRRGRGNVLGNLGNLYFQVSDVDQAINCYEQCLVITQQIGDRRGEANALGNLGIVYSSLGDARRAISYYEQQLVISREIGDRLGEGNTFGNLGITYENLGDARRAIGFHEQQLEIACDIGDRRGEGTALGNLGLAHASMGDLPHAIACHERALAISREIGDRRGEAADLGNLGNAYDGLDDARLAIEYWQQASIVFDEIGDTVSAATVGLSLALLLALEGRFADARPHAERAAEVFTQIDQSQEACIAYQLLAEIRAVLG